MIRVSSFAPLFAALCLATFSFAQDPFAEGVRTTPHLSPEEERQSFKLPEGFEASLVAAEPVIQKPLNLAFDAKGRLWVTDSIEYPYAAPLDQPGRDTIKILEDIDGDGRYEKITTFADGLNIPIGLLPYGDGVIAHSIPNIWYLRDTDGDGRCDLREKLYGPFDHTRDTHGMENAFRRGYDGWIYACHGFNNDSRVKGADGHEVHMQSGNTFRFRPDGSRIEHFSKGQVNPFGMCFDDRFNLFTADCHSKPITQVMRGGCYPSFGKPHDGLGFVPSMMEHSHGSTAICGIVHVNGDMFPAEYRGRLLSGNVMTSRLNHNSLVASGSTLKCKEEPDFMSAGDPWFRPVDLRIGPDGALYIADFYNRIIGHYEVPLTHPGRDRTSGRIWRIAYTAADAKKTRPPLDLTKADAAALIAELKHPVALQRQLAADQLCERVGKECVPAVRETFAKSAHVHQRVQCLWVLHRLDAGQDECAAAAAESEPSELRIHAMKVASEMPKWSNFLAIVVRAVLADADGFVARAAADALARHPDLKNAMPLLKRLEKTAPDDNHLNYILRFALRETARSEKDRNKFQLHGLTPANFASIALSIDNEFGAAAAIGSLGLSRPNSAEAAPYYTHIARYGNETTRAQAIASLQKLGADDFDATMTGLTAFKQGLVQRGESIVSLSELGERLVRGVLERPAETSLTWSNEPLAEAIDRENPWTLQQRMCQDKQEALFTSSLPKGERKTGRYRSQPFAAPAELSFWMAGHLGPIGEKPRAGSGVTLRNAADNAVLAEAVPPRNDTAQRTLWKLKEHVGKQVVVEIIDADSESAYAWIAVGRFSLDSLNPVKGTSHRIAAAQLAGELKLESLRPLLAKLSTDDAVDPPVRNAYSAALVAIDPDPRAAALVRAADDTQLDTALRTRIAQAIVDREPSAIASVLGETLKFASAPKQTSVAETLCGNVPGAEMLLQLAESGKISAAILNAAAVKQRLEALKNPELSARRNAATAKLPPVNETLDRLIQERRAAYQKAKGDAVRGATVFVKQCAACHQVEGKGAVIGPQLDGIGLRGLDRILEDVIAPHRNVDVAFRTTNIVLKDGRIVTGLVRREEGEQLILADRLGKEISIAKQEIEEKAITPLSLMPEFFRTENSAAPPVTDEEFHDLLEYLVTRRTVREETK